jgi:hypothetical protein
MEKQVFNWTFTLKKIKLWKKIIVEEDWVLKLKLKIEYLLPYIPVVEKCLKISLNVLILNGKCCEDIKYIEYFQALFYYRYTVVNTQSSIEF